MFKAMPLPSGPDQNVLGNFVALDFETANTSPGSACAIGWVLFESGNEAFAHRAFVDPGPVGFTNSWIHGIEPHATRGALGLSESCIALMDRAAGATFIAAHNAAFEKRVLKAALGDDAVGMMRILCTVRLARAVWDLRPTTLPAVCEALDIRLDHHDALSDARASGLIVARALETKAGRDAILDLLSDRPAKKRSKKHSKKKPRRVSA